MANPRKFSEKIAQHKQKQAEETAEFERIMREVSDVTSKPEEATLGTQYAAAAGANQQRGGSSPSRSPVQRGRAASSVGPMRARPADRKHDTSPYGSAAYLSPPADWRRTNSDSALHQSCGDQQQPASPQPHSPHHYHQQHQHHPHRHNADASNLLSMLGVQQTRPRSSCEIPRVPGISVYESGGGGSTLGPGGDMQVPGGSLPDLTAFHTADYPGSPHRTPPDYHREPYQQSPTSPGQLSPAGGGLSPVGAGGSALHAALRDHPHHNYDTQSMSPLEQSWLAGGYQTAHCSPPSIHSSHSNINIPSPAMGGHSPGSPGGESPQPDSFYISQTLLQPFQQISMMDNPASGYSTGYVNHTPSSSPRSNASHHQYSTGDVGNDAECRLHDTRTSRDPVAGGNAPLFPHVNSPGVPASIPDIIFTDFSGDLSMTKEFEAGLFGYEEERLREGLDPVDLDGLTLLSDAGTLLSDPAAEDVFRLDRL